VRGVAEIGLPVPDQIAIALLARNFANDGGSLNERGDRVPAGELLSSCLALDRMHQRRKSLSPSCREIARQWHYDPRMFWTGFAIGIAVCLAIGLAAHCVREWRQRSAFIVSLSSAQREALRGFETVTGGDWRAFRDLSPSGLALQLPFCFEVGSLSNRLMSSTPE
jgi:hypothetical protein